MTIQMIIAVVLIIIGLLFMVASLAGIIRLPDFFARLHAQGVGDTLGAFLILAGLMVWTGANLLSVKILLIFIIIVLTNPIGTNLMMIAAINREDYQGYATRMKGQDTKDQKPAEPDAAPELLTADEQEVAAELENEPDSMTILPEEKAHESEPEPYDEKKSESHTDTEEIEKQDTFEEISLELEEKEVTESVPESHTETDEKVEQEAAPEPEPEKKSEPEKESKPEKKQGAGKKKKPRKRKPSMNMNKKELTSIAEKRGIEIPEGATKRQILDLIYSNKKN